MGGLLEGIPPEMLKRFESLNDGELGPAQLVVFDGIDEKAIERAFQVAGKFAQCSLADKLRRRRDDQVRSITEVTLQLGCLIHGRWLIAHRTNCCQLLFE